MAYVEFVKFRFSSNGGEPYCPHCQCTAVYTLKARPIFRCKMCEKQFSATSGTPWAHRKIGFRDLMILIADFNHTAVAVSTRQICRNIGVNYKTALLWVHKIRAEIARAQEKQTLHGEIEADGCHNGGQPRRKNFEKDRKNTQRIHYRHRDTSMVAIVALERHGAIRTWIGKDEGDARTVIKDALAPNSTLFTDEAPAWSWFKPRVENFFQINHKKSFYTAEACTNCAESFFSALRNMARTHRHVVQNYFDLYVAEVAWRVQRNRVGGHESFAGLMEMMSRPGLSDLTGYYQGRKRLCKIVNPDGSTGGWRPPTKAERDLKRQEKDPTAKPFVPRWLKAAKVWDRGFKFVDAQSFLAKPSEMPSEGGVYAIFLRDGSKMLDLAGFAAADGPPLWSKDGVVHVYTGESYDLRTRLLQHLTGVSHLHDRFLALQFAGALPGAPKVSTDPDEAYRALNEWLASQVVIGYRSCGYVRDAEAAILKATASPLNLARCAKTPFRAALMEMERRFDAEIGGNWPKRSYDGHRGRR